MLDAARSAVEHITSMAKPLAILLSDIHLSHRAPVARSEEPDWYAAMARPLKQVRRLSRELGGVAVVAAGDIFHKWNSPPELINFALRHLPDEMYCVPGQHDLPLHVLEDKDKSAYGVLVRAGKIIDLNPSKPLEVGVDGLVLHAFPWNVTITPCPSAFVKQGRINLAVAHAYIWRSKETGYPGADPEKRVGSYQKALRGYDAAVFGDNHKGFKFVLEHGCVVFNHGTFYRRTSDEINWKPRVGVLFDDGRVEDYFLATEEDRMLAAADPRLVVEDDHTLGEFVKELNQLGGEGLNFETALDQYFKTYEVSEGATKLIKSILHD